MADHIKPDQFGESIAGILEEFKNVTNESMRDAVDSTAKDAVDQLKANASQTGAKHHLSVTGEYLKGWASKVTSNDSNRYGRTVFQRKKPGLPHLLQNGHGGPAPAKAYSHIPSDEEVEQLMVKNLKEAMNKE